MLGKGKRVGEYVLLEKLGAGGFGEVWKAEKRTELSVSYFALKFFRPKDDEAIDVEVVKKEIQTWQNLSGLPNVISVIEANRFEDYVFIVSEFAEGGSLEKWLKANGGKANSHEEAVAITRQILQGLEGMHGEGFVHRDLKPANVLLKRGAFYLADFGISRQMKTHSKTNSTAGTYEFMPPEAFEKSPSVTPQTDIWATGAILQVLLTGQLPFPQEEIPSLITAILYNEPEPLLESVSLALREIVRKSLEKKREDRFQSAAEMREALRNALTAKKIVKRETFSQAATLVVEDSDKTAKYEIAPTQDWEKIEAEKQRQREREESRWRKEAEEAKRLQALRFQRQAEIERLKREKEEKEQRERNKKQRSAKISRLLLGISAVILSPFIIALVWTKPWETDDQPITDKMVNQPANSQANQPTNTAPTQPTHPASNSANMNSTNSNSSNISQASNSFPVSDKNQAKQVSLDEERSVAKEKLQSNAKKYVQVFLNDTFNRGGGYYCGSGSGMTKTIAVNGEYGIFRFKTFDWKVSKIESDDETGSITFEIGNATFYFWNQKWRSGTVMPEQTYVGEETLKNVSRTLYFVRRGGEWEISNDGNQFPWSSFSCQELSQRLSAER